MHFETIHTFKINKQTSHRFFAEQMICDEIVFNFQIENTDEWNKHSNQRLRHLVREHRPQK